MTERERAEAIKAREARIRAEDAAQMKAMRALIDAIEDKAPHETPIGRAMIAAAAARRIDPREMEIAIGMRSAECDDPASPTTIEAIEAMGMTIDSLGLITPPTNGETK